MRHILTTLTVFAFAVSAVQAEVAVTVTPTAAAVIHPDRLEEDRDADRQRKPDQVLEFFGIRPGMAVLEMFAGGGYYTELLSYVVGSEGRVVAHNNTPYLQWSKSTLDKRFTSGRLENVERLTAENNELDLPGNSFDAALLILAYHDVYYVDETSGWSPIDGPAMLAEIHHALRPGAVVGVVDHAAMPGSPAETGNTLHRIDPELLRKEFEAAGFAFEADSEILRNPEDDLGRPVFAPDVRGKTDRFVYRFRRQ
jgi:predicted methyltransferase